MCRGSAWSEWEVQKAVRDGTIDSGCTVTVSRWRTVAYLTLYRKYRPQRFDEIVGQDHVTRTIQNAIATDKVAHAYLFNGPRGTGKTTTARILAKSLNCTSRPGDVTDARLVEPCNECASCIDITRDVSFDVQEVDAASNRGIDDIRSISERAQQAASDPSRFRVFIIDEVHQLSRDGASAFLKTLEEPPENVVFVLATTDPERMISTILSRCQRFDFRPVPTKALVGRLEQVCGLEGIKAEPAALEAIARRAHGGVRDALSALEQARSLYDDEITAAEVVEIYGGIDTDDLDGVVGAIAQRDSALAIRRLAGLVERGLDVRMITRELVEYLRSIFLIAAAGDVRDLVDVGDETYEEMSRQAQAVGAPLATRSLGMLGDVLVAMPQSLSPRVDLETAIVRLAHPQVDSTIEALVDRVAALEKRLESGSPTPRPASNAVAQPPAAPSVEPAATPAAEMPDPAPRADRVSVPKTTAAPPRSAARLAPPESSPASQTPQTSVGPVDLATVEQRWASVLDAIGGESRKAKAFLSDSTPLALEDSTVVVVFVNDYCRQQATTPQVREMFASVTERVLGVALKIVGGDRGCESSQESARSLAVRVAPKQPEPPAIDVDAQLADADDALVEPAEPVDHRPETDVTTAGIVDLVKSGLDGEVVEEREIP